jgi:hypothetical protein
MTATATEQARALVSRAVLWTGLALGTAVTVLAVMNGVRIPRLEVVLSVVATWALLMILAVVVVELLRRHHRAIGRHAARYGKQGAAATSRHARRHGRTVHTWLVSRALARWENRDRQPLMFRKVREDEAMGTRRVDGKPETDADKRFFDLRESGYTGPVNRNAYAVSDPPANTPGGPVSAPVSRIKTEHRAQRAAARSGGAVPSEWGPVIAQTADFEPEDDGALLEWMTRQVTGLSAWAEALVDFYEHCTGVVGIDPKASAMLHDVADAAAGAAETMGAAKARFTEHYELPREFAGNGGLMTHDGRWITGEGA